MHTSLTAGKPESASDGGVHFFVCATFEDGEFKVRGEGGGKTICGGYEIEELGELIGCSGG